MLVVLWELVTCISSVNEMFFFARWQVGRGCRSSGRLHTSSSSSGSSNVEAESRRRAARGSYCAKSCCIVAMPLLLNELYTTSWNCNSRCHRAHSSDRSDSFVPVMKQVTTLWRRSEAGTVESKVLNPLIETASPTTNRGIINIQQRQCCVVVDLTQQHHDFHHSSSTDASWATGKLVLVGLTHELRLEAEQCSFICWVHFVAGSSQSRWRYIAINEFSFSSEHVVDWGGTNIHWPHSQALRANVSIIYHICIMPINKKKVSMLIMSVQLQRLIGVCVPMICWARCRTSILLSLKGVYL